MTNKEKIALLKEYRNYLLSLKEYQQQMEEEQNKKEEQQTLDKPKVLVLKKKFNGRDMVVA